jgi:hypothetical protein
MSTDLHATAPGSAEMEVPAGRLFRLTEDRFRRMAAAGVFGPAEPIALVDGLVREGGTDGPPYRFRLDQYHRMGAEGVLAPSDRVELLEGRLVAKMSINPPHRFAVRSVRLALERILPPGWYAEPQAPVSMPLVGSEPEPDVQVARGESIDYADRHPVPADIALLVEVSDTTLAMDQGYKKRLYASEGVPIYWIVNIPKRHVEVYDEPSGPAEAPDYARCRDYGQGERIPVVIEGREVGRVDASELLP